MCNMSRSHLLVSCTRDRCYQIYSPSKHHMLMIANVKSAAHTKMERSRPTFNIITYTDRKTNIWVRERIKVIDIISNVRQMKWSWLRHINRLTDDRWTSRVTTWRPWQAKMTRETRQAVERRPGKYRSDTIWQRKAQDRLTWRRHAETFAQPRDTNAVQLIMLKKRS